MNNNIDDILIKADKYLEHWGEKKNLNWFDMSHLLSYLFPDYTKEELLKRHMILFDKEVEQND